MQLRVAKIRICFGKHKRMKRAAEGCQKKGSTNALGNKHKTMKRAAERVAKIRDMLWEAKTMKMKRAAEACS